MLIYFEIYFIFRVFSITKFYRKLPGQTNQLNLDSSLVNMKEKKYTFKLIKNTPIFKCSFFAETGSKKFCDSALQKKL